MALPESVTCDEPEVGRSSCCCVTPAVFISITDTAVAALLRVVVPLPTRSTTTLPLPKMPAMAEPLMAMADATATVRD